MRKIILVEVVLLVEHTDSSLLSLQHVDGLLVSVQEPIHELREVLLGVFSYCFDCTEE